MDIELIIKPLEDELVQVQDREFKLIAAIDNLTELVTPANGSENKPAASEQVESRKKTVTVKPSNREKTADKPSRYKGSKYKGVSRMGKKWRVQFYIPGQGNKHIGSFKTEELAHIAYEKFKAAYQEQIENNPDRPEKEYFYICNHCGLKYSERPDNCRGCNSTSFGKRKKEQG